MLIRSVEWSEHTEVSHQVVSAVAEEEAVAPWELDPLYAVIDPDALNAMFQQRPSSVRVSFAYHGYQVTVTAGGVIELRRFPENGTSTSASSAALD